MKPMNHLDDRVADRKETSRARAAAVAAVIAVVVLAPGARAASPDDAAVDISRSVMSPFCPGVTLHDCPSAAAERLRRRIEQWLRAGTARNEVMARLEKEFGSSIRAAPPATGAGLGAWLLPGLGVIAGAVLAAALARRWTATVPVKAAPLTDAERRRLDDELTALRESR